MKKILFVISVLIGIVGLVFAADGFRIIQLSSVTGSGGIDNFRSGEVYLTIDTTGADTSGVAFKSAVYNTDNTTGSVQGFVHVDYIEDSTDYVDTLILKLMTAMTDNDAALAWTIACDTFDTSFYKYCSYTGDDTLFKAITWYEFNIFDSTSDSIGYATDPTRKYRIKMGFGAKE